MAQVILENIYKSFPSRTEESTITPVTAPAIGVASESAMTVDSSAAKSRRVNVLRCINLTVQDGEFMVLVGPSGCGKSTLLRVIAGLEELTGGNIRVGDRLVNELPPKERDMAMVFQNYALYPHLNVYDNIAFGLRRMHKGQAESSLPNWMENLLVSLTRSFPKGFALPPRDRKSR